MATGTRMSMVVLALVATTTCSRRQTVDSSSWQATVLSCEVRSSYKDPYSDNVRGRTMRLKLALKYIGPSGTVSVPAARMDLGGGSSVKPEGVEVEGGLDHEGSEAIIAGVAKSVSVEPGAQIIGDCCTILYPLPQDAQTGMLRIGDLPPIRLDGCLAAGT